MEVTAIDSIPYFREYPLPWKSLRKFRLSFIHASLNCPLPAVHSLSVRKTFLDQYLRTKIRAAAYQNLPWEKKKRIEIAVSSVAIFCLMESNLVVHNGGCHCGKVRWRVQAPSSVVAWSCNCSNCSMRGCIHFVVPSKNFDLAEDSKQFIATYTFGTHTAKHTFCKVCGITSFYIQRSNPDGVAVTYKCVDPGTLAHVEIKHYNGLDWESSYGQTGIAACSKVQMEESQ